MTKADIVHVISTSVGLTKVETEAVVNGFMETVIDAMKRGEHIELRGFGSFKVVKRAKRVARNPKTIRSRTSNMEHNIWYHCTIVKSAFRLKTAKN